ncbi:MULTISPECIES: hypothetical protein [Bordetella]|uniref:Uncharacterized protein n=1 Tax=Bordetella petrii TaxID=94624 RepID=A0ABT7W2F0_9BORD|nr:MULTISPECIES: hypothetical protein [Bordetella]MDM9559380.1 hypothetical protein [Bordetella petrii]
MKLSRRVAAARGGCLVVIGWPRLAAGGMPEILEESRKNLKI